MAGEGTAVIGLRKKQRSKKQIGSVPLPDLTLIFEEDSQAPPRFGFVNPARPSHPNVANAR